eukprot:3770297-Amphidinium_carterae.4
MNNEHLVLLKNSRRNSSKRAKAVARGNGLRGTVAAVAKNKECKQRQGQMKTNMQPRELRVMEEEQRSERSSGGNKAATLQRKTRVGVTQRSRGQTNHAQEGLRFRSAGAWRGVERVLEGARDTEADEGLETQPAKGVRRPRAAEVVQHNLTHSSKSATTRAFPERARWQQQWSNGSYAGSYQRRKVDELPRLDNMLEALACQRLILRSDDRR